MTTTTIRPPYAGAWEVPEGTPVAWGARLIIDQDGHTDLLWDRQGAEPADSPHWAALQAWLDSGAISGAIRALRHMLSTDQISTREDRDVLLLDDGHGVIRGNPRASAGYCYIVAYLTGENA